MTKLYNDKNYRNEKLLALAQYAPCSMCDKSNDETIVACHSNAIEDGHGMGIKAHDIVAFGCKDCHDRVDGRIDKHLTKDERNLIFYRGVYKTWLWIMREGHLK